MCRPLTAMADHLFTTLPWRLGSQAHDDEGWDEVARALGVQAIDLTRLRQVHGAAFLVASAGGGASRPTADIIINKDSAAALAVQAADCIPLLIADQVTGAVAAVHAGWRGLALRAPQAAVDALVWRFGCRPSDLVAAVGPSIGACCYEVGIDVLKAFDRAGLDETARAAWFLDVPQPTASNPSLPGLSRTSRPNHWFFDAWSAARYQLESAGVPADQIHVAGLCTASHPGLFPSYRRDGTGTGRIAGAIRKRQPQSAQSSQKP